MFHTRLTFRPFSTESFTHRKLTLSLADRSSKTQKICMLPSVGKDPDARRSEMIKKEEVKLKASIRKESQHRVIKDRAYKRGLNSNFLEMDMEDEDEDGVSLARIKNQYKRGPISRTANKDRFIKDSDSEDSVDGNVDEDDDSEEVGGL